MLPPLYSHLHSTMIILVCFHLIILFALVWTMSLYLSHRVSFQSTHSPILCSIYWLFLQCFLYLKTAPCNSVTITLACAVILGVFSYTSVALLGLYFSNPKVPDGIHLFSATFCIPPHLCFLPFIEIQMLIEPETWFPMISSCWVQSVLCVLSLSLSLALYFSAFFSLSPSPLSLFPSLFLSFSFSFSLSLSLSLCYCFESFLFFKKSLSSVVTCLGSWGDVGTRSCLRHTLI